MWMWVTLSDSSAPERATVLGPEVGWESWAEQGGLGHRKAFGLLPRWLSRGRQGRLHTCTDTHRHVQPTSPGCLCCFRCLLPMYSTLGAQPWIWAQAGYLVPVGH